MTEHQKLQEISEKIGYRINFTYSTRANIYVKSIPEKQSDGSVKYEKVDVREIIFTQEFITKFWDYCTHNIGSNDFTNIHHNIMSSLDNPVDYLYDLIK